MSRKTRLPLALAAAALLLACFGGWVKIPPPESEVTTDADRADELFGTLGPPKNSPVAAFPFRLNIKVWAGGTYHHDVPVNELNLAFEGESSTAVRTDGEYGFVSMRVRTGPGLIEAWAEKEEEVSTTGGHREPVPEKCFNFQVNSLWLPPDRRVFVRLRFKDSVELFALRYEPEKKSLRLEVVRAPHGRVGDAPRVPFARVEVRDGERRVQCNSLSVSACRGERLLWERPLHMRGQPETLRVVGKTLFATTTECHSFYLDRENGEVIFYDASRLPGKQPVDEVLALGRKQMAKAEKLVRMLREKETPLSRFIYALGVLEDRRAIPFLIDSIDKSAYGIEIAWAVACLEKFNGNPEIRSWSLKNSWDGNRLFEQLYDRSWTEKRQKAEQEKWRQIFRVGSR